MSRKSVKFYWESKGDKYDFDPDKNYVIYYRGCFCPATRGHVNTISEFIHLDNATFFIHQGGSQGRHGVPYDLSRKIWQIYIKELLPEDKTVLMGRGSHQTISNITQHHSIRESDIVVFIAGNENYNEDEAEYEAVHTKYRKEFRDILRAGKDIIFIYLNRPQLGTLSATELCKAVIRNKDKDSEEKYNNLRQYFPENLSDKGLKYIINKLEQCNLF